MNFASILFSVTVALVLWTIGGYPAWLAFRARSKRRSAAMANENSARNVHVTAATAADTQTAAATGSELPTVTAVIPVYNGAAFLAQKMTSLFQSDYPSEKLNIVLLSDGSTDGTDAIAESYVATGRVRFVRLAKGGKAIALSTAFPTVSSDIILLTDVRQALEPDCIRNIVAPFTNPAVGAVSGTLKIRSGETAGEANTGLYWRYESWIRGNLSFTDSVIGATGPIYAIRRSLARSLPPGCILDDMWLPMQIVLEGYRSVLADDAVAWDFPTSLDSEFNRKVRTQAGLYQLIGLEPRLLNPAANRLFWQFCNLKLGRLFLPHMLIIIAITSFWLPAPLNVIALSLQAAFYGAFFADKLLPESNPLKRITGPLAAFVTLVTAAFFAQAIFFRDPASLWKTTTVRLTNSTS